MNLYRNKTDNKQALTDQIFKPFCQSLSFGNAEHFANILYGRYVVEDFSFSDDWVYWTVHSYFLNTVVQHKIAVFEAGIEMATQDWFKAFINESDELWIDNLWLHDISKFSANESIGYALHNFKSDKPDKAFDFAWNHHKTHNEHHPEYWMNVGRNGVISPLDMPKIYLAEMVADWIGAGKTYGSSLEEWLPKNIFKFVFHENTMINLQFLLSKMGFDAYIEGGKIKVNGSIEKIIR